MPLPEPEDAWSPVVRQTPRCYLPSVTIEHNLRSDSSSRSSAIRLSRNISQAAIEQRYFTDWYPFRLARIGGAIFADAGRVWGRNPLGDEQRGWLTDIGIGLRIAPTRGSSGKVIHLDLAFPLNGDDTIDDVQILLEAKRSF